MADAVLVVDDEADLLMTYRRLLQRRGYAVITVSTRTDAMAVVRSTPLGLVIADLKLPDGDGLDIVRAARAAPSAPPVIVVTGFASDASQQEALAAGATAYLSKPFSVSSFTGVVERLTVSRVDGSQRGGAA